MKKLIITTVAAIALLASSHRPQATANAVARQYQGVYVFTDSDPSAEFTVLGTVSIAVALGSAQYESVRDRLIKKALKEYPKADGIILTLREGKADKADCIKFD